MNLHVMLVIKYTNTSYLGIQQYIFRFQITVDDIEGMHVTYCASDLGGVVTSSGKRSITSFKSRFFNSYFVSVSTTSAKKLKQELCENVAFYV